MRITDALGLASQLADMSDSPRLDIEIMLCKVLDKPSSYLMTWPEKELSVEQQTAFQHYFDRRLSGEPLAYILGSRAFWTFELEVSPFTLIPRSDTEVLVETALSKIGHTHHRVLDLGTGTGAIALALASERPEWDVWGCDRVPEAVSLARRNQSKLDLDRVHFVEGNWFEPLSGQFHLIVSNPPYIDPQDSHLQQGDVRFEPRSALVADDHGLADIKQIIEKAPAYLYSEGWLMFEHGYDQGEDVRMLFVTNGFDRVETCKDYAGNDRVTLGCWRPSREHE